MERKRRDFLKKTSIISAGTLVLGPNMMGNNFKPTSNTSKPIGLVGMDTSHSPQFVEIINSLGSDYKVTTAFTTVSRDFPPSVDRVEKFTAQIKSMGVEIVDSIDDLLGKVDYVLLCTVDGRLHLEQAEKILKAKKRVFIDKPMAASLDEVKKIFALSKEYNTPTFSSSSVRFLTKAKEVRNGSIGNVQGAQIYAPISYEPTQPRLYWYGVHGAELLFTAMQQGCKRVRSLVTEQYHMVIGDWGDGKIGTYCGLKNKMQEYGGQAFGDKGVSYLGKYESSLPLIEAILHYFDTGEVPVEPSETIELFAFMDAAQKSEQEKGNWIAIEDILGTTP
ncbi:Gfo/Idh/MocA family protein [Flagellimonas iocasae]|uniref:Gfo/Idh/MocA family protein n=1 Tax=Flagellimonas iocasae TaxID=2055905 RepID=A0ABW4Y155_9FLAO